MKISITISLLLTVGILAAQVERTLPNLSINVPTGATPWSSLEFNNNPNNFQFAIVSDRTGGHRPGVFLEGIKRLNLLQPEFVMSVGDLIEGYTEDTQELNRQWEEFNGFIEQLDFPFFYVPGNHDITNKVMYDLWKEKFGKDYYSFVYGDVLFLCLNSEDQYRGAGRGTISDTQYEWVKNVLENNQEVRWTMLFMHQPLWHQEDTKRWKDVEALLSQRPHSVFTGHEHRYVKEARNNGNYYVLATTGGGSSLRGPKLGEFDHVIWMTMTDEGPVMANLQLEGVWKEDVVDKAAKDYINTILNKTAIKIEPLYVRPKKSFKKGIVQLKITNDEDVPMTVKFQESFSWDLVGKMDKAKVEVAPNSVQIVNLDLRARKPMPADQLRPFKLKATVSYDAKDMPKLNFPFTYQIKPEIKHSLKKAKAKVIDADLSEWGELAYAVPTEDTKSVTAKFDISYDEKYLYVAARVTDDQLKVMQGSSPWTQDYVGIVVNAEPSAESAMDKGTGWFRESIYLLQTAEGNGIASNVHPAEGLPEGIQKVCKKTADGYVMETAIPLTYITERQGKDWQSIRFNMLIGDLDSDGQELYWFMPNWRDQDNRVGSGMFFR